MLQQLVLLHRLGGAATAEPSQWLEVKTCLRSIWLGLKSWDRPNLGEGEIEVFTGPEAYSELLEIACGLKSPVLGETEVFGQVKRACQAYQHPEKKSHAVLQNIIQKMYTDVKRIRTLHLKNTGSKSYGSYARKFFKGQPAVRVLGTGPLAKEILPWLTKSTDQVIVHSRTPQTKVDLETTFHVSVQGFADLAGPKVCGLLVAAPMTAAEIGRWISANKLQAQNILDLRESSSSDPLESVMQVNSCQTLSDVFKVFEKTLASTQHIKQQALHEIYKCVRSRFQGVDFRPEGWDECVG